MAPEDSTGRPAPDRRKLLKLIAGSGIASIAGCLSDDDDGDGSSDTDGSDTDGSSDADGSTDSDDGSDSDGSTDTSETPESEEVVMGGELVTQLNTNVSSFDPTTSTDTVSRAAFELVYEPLMAVDYDGEPQPVLASSVEQTDDLTFQFELREGVTFHNGEDFTAEDVQKSLERYEGTPREQVVFQWYDSSEIIDEHTIDLHLSQPYAPFLTDLSEIPIVPSGVADGDINLEENPIGSGPYIFEEYQADSHFRISRNEDHWFTGSDTMPEQPPIETITFRVITEAASRTSALQSGELDIGLAIQTGVLDDFEDDDSFTVDTHVSGSYQNLILPQNEEANTPFQNAKVRRGFARLIPREGILEAVYDNVGTPGYSPISPLLEQYSSQEFQEEMRDEYIGYDPERAEQLLSEGFEESGFEAPFETTIAMGGSGGGPWSQMTQLVAESLENSGYFEVNLEEFEVTSFVGKLTSAESHTENEIYAIGFEGGWDPSGYVFDLLHSNLVSPACCNVNNYMSGEMDDLLEEGLATFDTEERQEIYEEIQRTVVENSPVVTFRFGEEIGVYNSDRVNGFETYPLSGTAFKSIYSPSSNKFTWLAE